MEEYAYLLCPAHWPKQPVRPHFSHFPHSSLSAHLFKRPGELLPEPVVVKTPYAQQHQQRALGAAAHKADLHVHRCIGSDGQRVTQ